MSFVGEVRTQPGLDGSGYSSRIDKSSERGGIGFYEVGLKDSGIKVELAATTRAALQRYTYPATDRARVRDEVAGTFSKRAGSWRNVFDAEAGFARPRKADGEWVSPFDPYNTPGFVEGNAWQYTWFVPHDVPGLIDAMGRDRFVERLNEAFEKSAATRFSAPSAQHHLTPWGRGSPMPE